MNDDPMLHYQDQVDFWTQQLAQAADRTARVLYRERVLAAQIKNAAYQRVMFALLVKGIGLTLKREGQWATIFPDASEPGHYRYQLFDESGFIGHVSKRTPEEAVKEAFIEGFREVAEDDVLEQLSKTEKWRLGTLRNELVSQVNRGQLTFAEANERYANLAA